MKLEDVTPPHCYARAQRLLATIQLVRTAMGRAADTRPLLHLSGAQPREVYVSTTSLWDKANRLSDEVDAEATGHVPPMPALDQIKPGHVRAVLDAVTERLAGILQQLGLSEAPAEPALDPKKTPSDVLEVVIQCCRELSRCMERPFAPRDCYRQVELASAYVARLPGLKADGWKPAAFEANRRPADCFATLQGVLKQTQTLLEKAGQTCVVLESAPPDVLPGDVYDLATIVLGELALLHSVTAGATPMYSFTPISDGHRLPAHVNQAAHTLAAQLAALS